MKILKTKSVYLWLLKSCKPNAPKAEHPLAQGLRTMYCGEPTLQVFVLTKNSTHWVSFHQAEGKNWSVKLPAEMLDWNENLQSLHGTWLATPALNAGKNKAPNREKHRNLSPPLLSSDLLWNVPTCPLEFMWSNVPWYWPEWQFTSLTYSHEITTGKYTRPID